jgi:hypothetical protein
MGRRETQKATKTRVKAGNLPKNNSGITETRTGTEPEIGAAKQGDQHCQRKMMQSSFRCERAMQKARRDFRPGYLHTTLSDCAL